MFEVLREDDSDDAPAQERQDLIDEGNFMQEGVDVVSKEGSVAIDREPGLNRRYYSMISTKTQTSGASRDTLAKRQRQLAVRNQPYLFLD